MGRISSLAALAILALDASRALHAQTTGLIPLIDLGNGTYQGFEGGLYPGGANSPPPGHLAEALARAEEVVPRNSAGAPDPDGLIVMIAVGMSNTTHEFGAFERNEDTNILRNARVVLMDTGFGGQTASVIASPSAGYWTVMQQRLAAMGLTAAQVQVAWLKEAEANPANDFPIHAQGLRDNLELIANNLHAKFPNLKLCYVSSRIYGGYSAGSLNPEPQAYESGFSVKWLIEDQIAGDPGLNHGQLPGPVQSPLLLWGPYLWADGTSPRSDGLVWLPSDLEGDGVHPAPAGEQKVSGLLSAFFAVEPTAAAWWSARPDATLVIAEATDDAFVRAAAPSGNFGGDPLLLAQGGPTPTNTYLRFDTGAVAPSVALAKLSLRVDQTGGGRVWRVPSTAWNEGTITWSNAPPIGVPLVDLPQSSRDGTIAANVTSDVNADSEGLLAFASTTMSAGQASYRSGEAGDPPRLVLVLPQGCDGPDTDGDGRGDGCDCAPSDPTAFALPQEARGLHWTMASSLAWEDGAFLYGSGTRYDAMAGDLASVDFFGTGLADACLGNDLATAAMEDPTDDPAAGEGLYFLVRAQNACGAGRYETSSSGLDRLTTACP